MFKAKWSEERITELTKAGRGSGEGKSYNPWVHITDLSSIGQSTRIKGIKIDRVHHLLSKIERNVLLALEWDASVMDIREQYPLSRKDTIAAAEALGITYPFYEGTNVKCIMTVDFLTTIRQGTNTTFIAIDVKSDDAINDPRKIELLEITREYFARKGWKHHVIFESQLPATNIRNIKFIREALVFKDEDLSPEYFAHHCKVMASDLAKFKNKSIPLFEYCADYEARAALDRGEAMRIAKLLMFDRILAPNLSSKNLAKAPLSSFTVTGQFGSPLLVGSK